MDNYFGFQRVGDEMARDESCCDLYNDVQYHHAFGVYGLAQDADEKTC
jgi:hypothetical protein